MAVRLGSFLRVLVSFLVVFVVLKVERSEAVTYTVGDAFGWAVPTNDDFYDDWNDNKDFRVGDQLIFNWTGVQNVVQVSEAQYDNCANVNTNVFTTSPVTFNLTTIGDHYFICTIGDQCRRGQKLEIEVKPALVAPPPPPTPTPSPPASPVPSPPTSTGRGSVAYTVGDAFGWGVPTNDDFYDDWNDNKDFRVGDQLIFNWTGVQNVVEVLEAQYDSCTNVTTNVFTTSPVTLNLTTIGDHYFICTIGDQCRRGQKLEIEVKPALAAPTPTPPASPVPSPPSSTGRVSVAYTVGDAFGWGVPTNDDFYDNWNDNKDFRVGDQLIFNWTGVQNVVEVLEAQYDSCTNVTTNVFTTSPVIVNLTTIGDHYFICTIGDQCRRGQKLEIEVKPALLTPTTPATPSPSPSPPPSNPTSGPTSPPPTTTPAPSTSTALPPSNAAASPPLSAGTTSTPSPNASPSFGPMVALSAALSGLVFFFF